MKLFNDFRENVLICIFKQILEIIKRSVQTKELFLNKSFEYMRYLQKMEIRDKWKL